MRVHLLAAMLMVGVASADSSVPGGGHRTVITKSTIEILEKISFATNSATVLPSSLPTIDAVATALNGNTDLRKIEVGTHSDERGDDAYNLRLSQARADKIMQLLVERGVAADRLVAVGYGETKPLCSEHKEACWSRNRRTEFLILERR
jgi:outer membrane protein OmpA-like peptidoglycan-associated protein